MKGAKVLIVIVAVLVIAFIAFVVYGATKEEQNSEAPKPNELMLAAAELFCKPLEPSRIEGSKECPTVMSIGATCILKILPGDKNRILSLQHTDRSEVELTLQPLNELSLPEGVRAPAGKMEKKKLSKSFITSPAASVTLKCLVPDPATERCRVELK
jgi:hypothetical protein